MRKLKLLAIAILFIGFLVLLHQFLFYGYWFEIQDIHHETLALICFAFGAGLVFKR